MKTKLGMFWVTHKSVTMPAGRDMKILTAQRTIQIAGFVIMLSGKKKYVSYGNLFSGWICVLCALCLDYKLKQIKTQSITYCTFLKPGYIYRSYF